jgi:hypothetical protein
MAGNLRVMFAFADFGSKSHGHPNFELSEQHPIILMKDVLFVLLFFCFQEVQLLFVLLVFSTF